MTARAVQRLRNAGLTLLELLVVLTLVGLATALASFALREPGADRVEQDARRLAALLEGARADSRRSGQPVRWQPAEAGFRFEGLQGTSLPQAWSHAGMQASVEHGEVLLLGPEPVIGPQAVAVYLGGRPGLRWRVATDGVRPFAAQPASAASRPAEGG